jgi:ABC-type phosphate transport system auxiliary subunit
MTSRITNSSELIDRKTSRSICHAVGERLQQNLRPERSRLSPRLQQLMDQLRAQDREDHLRGR